MAMSRQMTGHAPAHHGDVIEFAHASDNVTLAFQERRSAAGELETHLRVETRSGSIYTLHIGKESRAAGPLHELRSLILTPEVRRPRVYTCRGCGLGFRAAEGHDFAGCAAIYHNFEISAQQGGSA